MQDMDNALCVIASTCTYKKMHFITSDRSKNYNEKKFDMQPILPKCIV